MHGRRSSMAKSSQKVESISTKDAATVEKLATLVQQAAGLDSYQAKMVVYYALATHSLMKLRLFPILVLYGPPGSGKTTILTILHRLAHEPRWLDGKAS
jgi:ATP-dependent Lon protease